jgi:hypothetical protein
MLESSYSFPNASSKQCSGLAEDGMYSKKYSRQHIGILYIVNITVGENLPILLLRVLQGQSHEKSGE